MKKVAIFRSDLLPYSETFIREQALALREWRPVMIGYRRIPDGLSLDGLEVHLLGRSRQSQLGKSLETLRYWTNTPDPEDVSDLKRLNVSLVHAHFGPDAVDIWPAVKAAGLPMLVTLHGYDINIHREWWEAGNAGLRRRVYPRRLLTMARHPRVGFVAVSEAIRRRAIEYGISESKLAVCHIGVDINRFVPDGPPMTSRSRRILFVGRLVEKKGVEYLIRALALVRKKVSDAELVIAGDGPLRSALERLARDLSLSVTFLGALPSDDIKRRLDTSRVLCLPSITAQNGDAEGFGLVVLESQASGVPVVTSACGAADEGIAHGVTGFHFPEKDIEALAETLARMLDDDALLSRMAMECRSFVLRKFNVLECTHALERIYHQCAEKNPRCKP